MYEFFARFVNGKTRVCVIRFTGQEQMRFKNLFITALLVVGVASIASAQDHGRDDHRDDHRNDHTDRNRDRDRNQDAWHDRQSGHSGSSASVDIRIGVNDYHDNHNIYRRDMRPPVFEVPRHWDDRRSSIDFVFRSGYYGYGLDWRDRAFNFRFYVFDYPRTNPAFSPWYLYPHLPAYVDNRKVSFDPRPLRPDVGRRERFDYRNNTLDKDLGNAIWDLTDAIEKADNHLVGNLVPRGYNVIIDPPVGRSYRMNSDDFYSLFVDMATTTHTRHFDVTDVQSGRDWAQVYARQDFEDSWGRATTEYMRVTFEYTRNGYRIAELAPSQRGL